MSTYRYVVTVTERGGPRFSRKKSVVSLELSRRDARLAEETALQQLYGRPVRRKGADLYDARTKLNYGPVQVGVERRAE